ncbi:hypothetical protein [Achromobacter spanius]|uniref:hypothetical protein n=1 Tax=Achromobacter spanius TaxID=217203 RepID=UPI00382E8F18
MRPPTRDGEAMSEIPAKKRAALLVFIVFMRRPAGVPKRSAEAETPAALVRRPEIRTGGMTARTDVSEYN